MQLYFRAKSETGLMVNSVITRIRVYQDFHPKYQVRILQKSQEKAKKLDKNGHETERVHKSRDLTSQSQIKSTMVNFWSTHQVKIIEIPNEPSLLNPLSKQDLNTIYTISSLTNGL